METTNTTRTSSSEGKRDTPLCEECDSIICRACWNKIAVPVPVSSEGEGIDSIRERLASHRHEVDKYRNHEWAKGTALNYREAPDDVECLLLLLTTIRNAERARIKSDDSNRPQTEGEARSAE